MASSIAAGQPRGVIGSLRTPTLAGASGYTSAHIANQPIIRVCSTRPGIALQVARRQCQLVPTPCEGLAKDRLVLLLLLGHLTMKIS